MQHNHNKSIFSVHIKKNSIITAFSGDLHVVDCFDASSCMRMRTYAHFFFHIMGGSRVCLTAQCESNILSWGYTCLFSDQSMESVPLLYIPQNNCELCLHVHRSARVFSILAQLKCKKKVSRHQHISSFNTLRRRQNYRQFAADIFKCIFVNENAIISMKISLKFIPKGSIDNIPALVQIMAWRRPGDKPLSEQMMVSLPTLFFVTRPQWVKVK